MAHININVHNDLYTIELDPHDWRSLTINGERIERTPGGYKWTQLKAGPVHFIATADGVEIVNPDNFMLLSGTGNVVQHVAALTYTSTKSSPSFKLEGYVLNHNGQPQHGRDQIMFAQENMGGIFRNL